MTPGNVIAVVCVGAFTVLVVVGLSSDAWRWWQDRRTVRLASYEECVAAEARWRLVVQERREVERLRSGAAWCEAWAEQLREIRSLPETRGMEWA